MMVVTGNQTWRPWENPSFSSLMFHSVILGGQVAKLRNGLTLHDKPPEDATSHTTPPLRRMKLKMLICTEIQGVLARWPRTNMLITAGFV